MKIKRIAEYGQPPTPGIYWIILEMGNDEEKDAARWDGEVWRYTENAADHLWYEEYGMPVLAWIDEQNAQAHPTAAEGDGGAGRKESNGK